MIGSHWRYTRQPRAKQEKVAVGDDARILKTKRLRKDAVRSATVIAGRTGRGQQPKSNSNRESQPKARHTINSTSKASPESGEECTAE